MENSHTLYCYNTRKHLNQRAKPVIIEVTGIADENLVLENGENAAQLLTEMREILLGLPVARQFERLQFCNFRLLNPVPASNLRFYETDFQGHPKTRNFQYYLSRI